MAVYVDDVAIGYGRMKMCHMWADTLDELLAMADAIGVSRRWLQQPPKASWVHFDICLTKKKKALAAGAILTDRYGPLEHTSRLAGHGGMLEKIAALRRRHGLPSDGVDRPPLQGRACSVCAGIGECAPDCDTLRFDRPKGHNSA